MARQPKEQLQIPIMYAFREAHKAKDAKVDAKTYVDGERVLSERAAMRRRGANEAQLKANFEIDLTNLTNTINLASCVDLDEHPNVAKSVLNYGIVDTTQFSTEDIKLLNLPRQLKEALLAHEPRFVPETMEITLREEADANTQSISFDVNAEMACKPVDIPMEFVAEIDVGAGKMILSNSGKS
ncbi:GPW/gp25 family protein [Alphaproteobacteria bacterium KMM 3653]|uniref:GPW/gp25 family protein n=1 Tax=Harenicola maris TaxID=2841044 RepID=A0AAP2G8A1_9RHOB|nr:GPW/gp25 family protein [Harenicola maris]